MNYRHLYHAGNFADVIKHIVLIALLKSLQRKATPFCFLDTHAGIGIYPLQSVETQKKQEYQNGIEKLWLSDKNKQPELIQNYIDIVSELNLGNLTYYPGSPFIAKKCIRHDDQIILCELHPTDAQTLKDNLVTDQHISIHHMDGYSGIKAFIPFKQQRGLVLIDPPFEVTNEFEKIMHSLKVIQKRWRSGNTMIWYPIKNKIAVEQFYREIASLNLSHFIIEFSLNQIESAEKLSSCGIVIINPPWQIKDVLIPALTQLNSLLDTNWNLIDRCH